MAFNLFRKIVPPASWLGVDIGTTSLKIVELARGGGKEAKPKLVNYGLLETAGYLERFNTAIQSSNLNLFESEAVNYLKIILRKANFQTNRALAALPAFAVFTTLIEMPVMSEEETIKAMNFHVKQYVPLAISSVTLDWLRVGERLDAEGAKKQQLFLIAIPNIQIENYKRIFSLAGLQLTALEVEGLSISRSLARQTPEPTLIIDIGSRSTAFLVAENGFLKASGQTDFAGASLTQSLASGLHITTRRAENLKKQKGLSMLQSGAERELSTQLLTILDVIINEAKRVKDNYEVNYRSAIKKIILSGGGANLLGIEDYLAKEMSAPVEKADPLNNINYPTALEFLKKDLSPQLTVAIGLAEKEL